MKKDRASMQIRFFSLFLLTSALRREDIAMILQYEIEIFEYLHANEGSRIKLVIDESAIRKISLMLVHFIFITVL